MTVMETTTCFGLYWPSSGCLGNLRASYMLVYSALLYHSSAEYTSTRIEQAATYTVHITQYTRDQARTLHCKINPDQQYKCLAIPHTTQ